MKIIKPGETVTIKHANGQTKTRRIHSMVELPDGTTYVAFKPIPKIPLSARPGTIPHHIAGIIDRSPNKAIPFSEYMRLALYTPTTECPAGGYYMKKVEGGGELADFGTDPTRYSPWFGFALAQKIENFWWVMGKPSGFQLVIMGEGNGVMVRDIMEGLSRRCPELYETIKVIIVEISPTI